MDHLVEHQIWGTVYYVSNTKDGIYFDNNLAH